MLTDGLDILKHLIRIDTTNPPGNEEKAADRCAQYLQEVHIPSHCHDAAPGRRNLMAEFGPANSEALIVSAHLDVVPADPDCWDHPPFDAVEADGCIWGRGTIDMKHVAAYGLAIMRQLARSQTTMDRRLRLVLFADEEAGCQQGSLNVASNRPDWLQGYAAVTEVGGFTMHVDGHRVYPIQVAEKGFVWMRLHIHGSPGHGSMPHEDNALLKLAEIVRQIGRQPFPFQRTQPVQDFLEAIARVLGFPKGAVFRGIGKRSVSNLILDKLVAAPDKTRVFRALLRNTIAPTMAVSGTKSNVIPGDAHLTVDCRILPGTDPDDFVRMFHERVPGDYDIEVLAKGPPVVMDTSHPIYNVLEQILRDADPGAHPVPQMLTGFTDARAFDQVGTPCFGFSPIWLPPTIPFAAMFHGHNERIPVHGFQWGLACMWELVQRLCVRTGDPI